MFTKDDAARTVLVIAVTALLGIGAMMTFSTASRGEGPPINMAFLKQMAYVAIGIACAVAIAASNRFDYRFLLRHKWVVWGLAVVLLALVLVPGIGHYVNGARRWIRIGPFGFQPSELAKIALLIFLAGYLGSKGDGVTSFGKTFLPAMACTGIVCALVVKEPDIGTTVLLCAVSWIVLFVAGSRLTYLLAPLPAMIPLALYALSMGYARERIEVWLNPRKDPLGAGYHIIQSLVAIGSGGTCGVGLGESTQKRYFLPESSSDFIFAILAEETGLIGATIVILFYAALIWAGITIARRAHDREGCLLATGVTSLIALQALVNMGVVTQLLPTKGIPLPFISAGGSSALFMLLGVGLLYNIARRSETVASN